jgi:hypothetical protein
MPPRRESKLAPKRSERDLQLLVQGYREVGHSFAAAIKAGVMRKIDAWRMIEPMGGYQRWMVAEWIRIAEGRTRYPQILDALYEGDWD